MKLGQKFKNRILIILALIFLVSSILGPIVNVMNNVNADEDEKDWHVDDKVKKDPDEERKDHDKKKEEFLGAIEGAGYSGDVDDYGDKLNKEKTIIEKTDDVHWYMQYLFGPGHYLEDVNKGTKVEGEGDYFEERLMHKHNGRKTACYWGSANTQDLLDHNCDIPAFGTELFQNIFRSRFPVGIQGGEKTASKSNFGIPAGLDGDVPVDPVTRGSKYSALELYGYNLPYTIYNGEWDDIQVSSAARLLSNVGFFQKVKILGVGIWNGAMNLLNSVTGNFSLNPTKWFRGGPGFVDGVVSTVVDSADMYVVGTRQWKRPFFAQTLYNVYYMSDMDIIEKSQADYKQYLVEDFFKKAITHPRLKKVLKFAPIYGEGIYEGDGLEWSEKEQFPRFDYMEYRECVRYERDEDGKETNTCAEWETEEEAFDRWKREDNQKQYDQEAHEAGIVQNCFEESKTYSELKQCWVEPWYNYAKPEMDFNKSVMSQMMSVLSTAFFMANPKYDPNQQIGHYIQADDNGVPIGGWGNKASWKYLYESFDETSLGGRLAADAKPARPSIKGAMFGNGEKDEPTDDRYIQFLKTSQDPIGNISLGPKIFKSISVALIKITNELISFSYDNIVEKLKLDIIVNTTVKKLTDGLFFPLSIIMAAISALFALARFQKYPRAGINSIAWLTITFMLGVIILTNPGKVIKTIEDVPTKIDNVLADIVLNQDKNSGLCTTTGNSSSIRSVQCTVWQVGVFTPWLAGQWGVTDYKKTDVSEFDNTNGDLVGDAAVNMGGGVIENNWSLYQLDKMKSGTITTEDPKSLEGVTSPSLYRLVDLQAGPNHSEKSDSRYFASWSGMNGNYRGVIQLFSMVVSIMIALTIGAFSIYKIEVTMLALIKFLLMPIHMLKNMGPNSRQGLLDYINQWFALFLRRVFIGIFMLVILSTFQAVTKTDTSYITLAIFLIVFMVVVKMYFREILDMIAHTSNAIEGQIGGYKKRIKEVDVLPKGVKQMTSRTMHGLEEGLIGAAAGAVVGAKNKLQNKKLGLEDGTKVSEAIKQGWEAGHGRGTKVEERAARRMGYGTLMNMAKSAEAARRKEMIKKDLSDFKEDTIEDTIAGRINFHITAKMNRKSSLEYKIKDGWTSDEEEKYKGYFKDIEQLDKEIAELKEIQSKLNKYKHKKSGNVKFADIAAKYNKYYDTRENEERINAIYNSLLESKVQSINKQYSKRNQFNQEEFNDDIDSSIKEMLLWNSHYNNMEEEFAKPNVKVKSRIARSTAVNAEMQKEMLKESIKTDTKIIEEEYNKDLYEYYNKLLIKVKANKENINDWTFKKNVEIVAKENTKKLELTKREVLLRALNEDLDSKEDNVFKEDVKNVLAEQNEKALSDERQEKNNVKPVKAEKTKEDIYQNDLLEEMTEGEVLDNQVGKNQEQIKNELKEDINDIIDKQDKEILELKNNLEEETREIDDNEKEAKDNKEKELENNSNRKAEEEERYRELLIKRAEQRRLQSELDVRKEIAKEIKEIRESNNELISILSDTQVEEDKEQSKPEKKSKELTNKEKQDIIKIGMIVEDTLEKDNSLEKMNLQKPKIEDYVDKVQELRDKRKETLLSSLQKKHGIDKEDFIPITKESKRVNENIKAKEKEDRKNEIYEEVNNNSNVAEKQDNKNNMKPTISNNANERAQNKRKQNFLDKLNNMNNKKSKNKGDDDNGR